MCKILHEKTMTFIKNIHLEISKHFIEAVCLEKVEMLYLSSQFYLDKRH